MYEETTRVHDICFQMVKKSWMCMKSHHQTNSNRSDTLFSCWCIYWVFIGSSVYMKVKFFSIEITFFSSLSILFQVLIPKTLKDCTCNDFYWSFRKSFFYRAGKIHEPSKVIVWKCWRSSSVEVVLASGCFVIRISHCND